MRSSAASSTLSLPSIGLALSLALAACGGGTPSAQSGQLAAAEAPVEVTIAAPEPVAAPAKPAVDEAPSNLEAEAGEGEAVAKVSPEERKKLEVELEKLDMVMLGALNAGGDASVLSAALNGSGSWAAGSKPGALVLGGGGGVQGGVGGGGRSGGSLQLGAGGVVGTGVLGAGAATATPTVKGPVGLVTSTVVSGADTIDNARAVLAGMTPGFRRCYNVGLREDPTIVAGGVELGVSIAANGEVSAVVPSKGKGLGSKVISCVVQRARSAMFSPPHKLPALFVFQLEMSAK
jgi:hypothetical protein